MTAAAPGQAERILPAYDAVGERELSEAVHQALGAASVCWEPMDCTGVFESRRAAQIGAELMGIIGQYADAAAQEPHAAPGPAELQVLLDNERAERLHRAGERDEARSDLRRMHRLALGVLATFPDGSAKARRWHEQADAIIGRHSQPQPAPELAAERDGLRKALRAISLGIAEPSPQSVARDALNGRYFDPETDGGVWSMSDPAEQVRLARADRDQLRKQVLDLAAELEASAARTAPSKKTDIENATAAKLRKAARPPS